MRAPFIAFVAVFGLMTALPAPVWAAPAGPHHIARGASAIELVRDGCGDGWHLYTRRDRWGKSYSKCAPNRW